MKRDVLLLACGVLLLAPANSGAQALPSVRDPHAEAPVVRAAPARGVIRVDGRLDERAWATAAPAVNFTQTDPQEGSPASERTEVRVLYSSDALYVGVRLHDSSGKVSSRLARRDTHHADSDEFTVTLDSRHDHLTAFQFSINPAGVKGDAVLAGGSDTDASWDPVWEAETEVGRTGWTAELRIPFSQLRFSPASGQVWGVQFARRIGRRQEQSVFAFTPKRERGGIARYGHLVGLEGIRIGRRLEVLPYVAARVEAVQVPQNSAVDFSNPYRDGSEFAGGAGVDVKYRLTSNLVVDATLNPDFGQVEADPAEVNLTAFETLFPERRPFFVEGADIFDFGGSHLFYSRRIGRRPQGTVPRGAIYQQVPETSTILGAAKLSGKTAGGWSVGVLDAVTAPEDAVFIDRIGEEHRAAVEPLSNYFVGRVKRDLRGGQTVLGAIATATHRALSDEALARRLRSAAYAGGMDFRHEWANRAWSAVGFVSSSSILGEAQAITAAQLSSARYYHRPDAEHLEPDPTATSLSGYNARLDVGKRAGLYWTGNVVLTATSPGYEINDLGYQTLADRRSIAGSLTYAEYQPGPVFQQWNVSGSLGSRWNFGDDFLGSTASLGASGLLLNYWGGGLSLYHTFAGLDDRLTWGGPLVRGLAETGFDANVYSDSREALTGSGSTSLARDAEGGWRAYLGMALGWRAASNWNVSVGPYLSGYHSEVQHLAAIPDPTAVSTYGHRHVFSDVSQTSFGLNTRLNVTFSPTLAFSLYAQPFLASSNFGSPKELAAPRTLDFIRYGEDAGTISYSDEAWSYTVDPDGSGPAAPFQVYNSDFNTRSLRGNAVLRWEYRPGSTLFLVWQQNRYDYLDVYTADPTSSELGRFDLVRDVRRLFRAQPDNVLMLKVNYWLNP